MTNQEFISHLSDLNIKQIEYGWFYIEDDNNNIIGAIITIFDKLNCHNILTKLYNSNKLLIFKHEYFEQCSIGYISTYFVEYLNKIVI